MPEVLEIILFSFASGVTVILGWGLAGFRVLESGSTFLHSITAFGAGIITAAVALVLVPEGIAGLGIPRIIVAFVIGVFFFAVLNWFIKSRTGRVALFLVMLLDFIPEALALGAVFSASKATGLLLAIYIGLQNLPESYSAYFEFVGSGFSRRRTFAVMAPFSLVGVVAALIGFYFLTGTVALVAFIMMFSAGGILYLVFQEVAPKARIKENRIPAVVFTLGFLVGVIGHILFA
ncbi:zinc transporter, ZIP family [Dehalogenimonas formicexedens]|uniref:Zinc transporter, ZIP family n=1 Tax=Dehalogenimonas formicexedens TaxID=1839801 RepID=A0A1P8FA79_9CHLR|nr:ZIP family metal transporter [Dehalogenimonas formicexedens]APV45365.1 zinc transporter, ZIP family [Dehalogenimonas formicexedens]